MFELIRDVAPGDNRSRFFALSGCGWGLIALLLGYDGLGRSIWGGVLAAPLIGIFIGRRSSRFADSPRHRQIVVSLVDLYVGAVAFAVAAALFDLALRPRGPTVTQTVLTHVLGVLWGLTFSGYVLVLWPLSFVNHRLAWSADGDRWQEPALRVALSAVAIRKASGQILIFVTAYYSLWAAILAISNLTESRPGRSSMPWWITTDVMGWSNWVLMALFIWAMAPLLARGARLAAACNGERTATYIDLVGVAGFVILVCPVFAFVATWIVMAVKVSLVHSWSTEGAVLCAGYYYRNVVRMNRPWLLLGAALIAIRTVQSAASRRRGLNPI